MAAILKERGIEPALERSRRTSWKEFLAAHREGLAAADFFSVEVLAWTGLVRYQVLFVMRLATRRVHLAGIVRDTDANGGWMLQVARNLTDAVDGFLQGVTHLILDRDPLFTKPFRQLSAYLVHYHRERPHQGLGGALIDPDETADRAVGRIRCRERLGGYLRYYHREAA